MATASVDLREDKVNYTVRLNLPDRNLDNVEIKLEDDTLASLRPLKTKQGVTSKPSRWCPRARQLRIHEGHRAGHPFTLPPFVSVLPSAIV